MCPVGWSGWWRNASTQRCMHSLTDRRRMKEREKREFVRQALALCPEYGDTICEFKQSARFGVRVAI